VDISIADIQNVLLMDGTPIPVRERDNHPIHIQDGIDKMGEAVGQMDEDPTLIMTLVPGFANLYGHTVEHMKLLPTNSSQRPAFNKSMQELGGILWNLGMHYKKLKQDEAEGKGVPALTEGGQPQAPAAESGGAGGEPDTLLRQISEFRARQDDIAYQQAQHEQALRHADEKAAQALRLEALRAAAKLQAA
jgi:hypothetical protein